jgi:hypothetical protein
MWSCLKGGLSPACCLRLVWGPVSQRGRQQGSAAGLCCLFLLPQHQQVPFFMAACSSKHTGLPGPVQQCCRRSCQLRSQPCAASAGCCRLGGGPLWHWLAACHMYAAACVCGSSAQCQWCVLPCSEHWLCMCCAVATAAAYPLRAFPCLWLRHLLATAAVSGCSLSAVPYILANAFHFHSCLSLSHLWRVA